MRSPFRSRRTALLCAAALTLAGSPLVLAEELGQPSGFDTFNRIQGEELGQLTGREGMNLTNVQSVQDMQATVVGSSIAAGSILSGSITIENQAMDNYQGVGLFNILTGHNNAVDAAVGISVYLTE